MDRALMSPKKLRKEGLIQHSFKEWAGLKPKAFNNQFKISICNLVLLAQWLRV
jgi:hypothetical protein